MSVIIQEVSLGSFMGLLGVLRTAREQFLNLYHVCYYVNGKGNHTDKLRVSVGKVLPKDIEIRKEPCIKGRNCGHFYKNHSQSTWISNF